MIPIYLCEDNEEELSFLQEIIEKYCFISAYDFQIVCAASSPAQLLRSLPEQGENAVYFLDVDLKQNQNGIQLAAKIRQKDPRSYIIFTTTHEEMASITFRYKVEALDYLIKNDPDFTKKVELCLENILQKIKTPSHIEGQKIAFPLPSKELFLKPEEIYYITAKGSHQIEVHTKDGIYPCSLSLSYVASQWHGFLFCHKSVLVNPVHIRTLFKSPCEIELDNGARCPCSVRKYPLIRRYLNPHHSIHSSITD
ncbi:MAG: response regulator transcription factor [Clostridiales bacterium]|nr:response regulator transcription factor [Clostridiales bacterium]